MVSVSKYAIDELFNDGGGHLYASLLIKLGLFLGFTSAAKEMFFILTFATVLHTAERGCNVRPWRLVLELEDVPSIEVKAFGTES